MKKHFEIPLLNDHHNHTVFYMILNDCLDVRGVADYNQAIKLIQKLDEEINIVLGWMFSEYNRKDIENLPPVLICEGSLHSFILNKKAKEILGKKYPEIISNIEDTKWVEKHLYQLIQFLSCIKKISRKNIDGFFKTMIEENQTLKMEDMLVPNKESIKLIKDAGYCDRCKFWMGLESYKKLKPKDKKDICGIKIFLDGSVGARTAALNGYVSGESGIKLYTDERLTKTLKYIEKEKTKAALHAIGEIAIEQLLNVVEKENIKIAGLQIEHAQYITWEQADRCKKLNITLSMQPNFSIESKIFKDRITTAYLKRNNPFRMLIDKIGFIPGKDLIFGSDGMPHGARAALENSLFPVLQSQKLTLAEFTEGYCVDSCEYGKISFDVVDNKIKSLRTVKPETFPVSGE